MNSYKYSFWQTLFVTSNSCRYLSICHIISLPYNRIISKKNYVVVFIKWLCANTRIAIRIFKTFSNFNLICPIVDEYFEYLVYNTYKIQKIFSKNNKYKSFISFHNLSSLSICKFSQISEVIIQKMCPIRLEINDFPISLKRLSSRNHIKIYHFDKKKTKSPKF